eukprot:s3761_g1.t1
MTLRLGKVKDLRLPSDDQPSGEKVARALSFAEDSTLKENLMKELEELEALLQKKLEVPTACKELLAAECLPPPAKKRRCKKNENDDDEQDEDEQEAESSDDGEDDCQDDDVGDDKGDDSNAGGRTRKAVVGKVTPKSKAKPKAKAAVSKSRAKAKACPKKTANEKASSSCEKPNKKDKKPKSPKERKQRDKELMKRKSKAYHRGKAEAIRNGATEEEAKEAGRKAC